MEDESHSNYFENAFQCKNNCESLTKDIDDYVSCSQSISIWVVIASQRERIRYYGSYNCILKPPIEIQPSTKLT